MSHSTWLLPVCWRGCQMVFKDEQFVNKYIHLENFTIVAFITIYLNKTHTILIHSNWLRLFKMQFTKKCPTLPDFTLSHLIKGLSLAFLLRILMLIITFLRSAFEFIFVVSLTNACTFFPRKWFYQCISFKMLWWCGQHKEAVAMRQVIVLLQQSSL